MGQTGAVCLFEYKDTKIGLSQRFIMTPRYYQSVEAKDDGDGLYEFRPLNQVSKLYSQVDKVEAKEGNHSGQFLITYQQREATNATNPEANHVPVRRVVAAVELSEISDFIKFDVTVNEIPIANYKDEKTKAFYQKQKDAERGKDVVIDWEFLDGFNTDSSLWFNSNGLDMHQKTLWSRKDYQMTETDNVAANFYPVTSAIVVRDKNSNKQVTIMPDRPQAGSAGLRGNKNIELMQNRRHNMNDYYGVTEPLNDVDSAHRGIQIKASYQMQIFYHNKTDSSAQRKMQRVIDQPLLVSYSNDFKLSKAYEPVGPVTKHVDLSRGPEPTVSAEDPNAILRSKSTFKSLVYAIGQKEVLLRVQNMQDSFDGSSEELQFDVSNYVRQLYQSANPKTNVDEI